MPTAAVPVRYRFARFELQPDERRLLDANEPIAVAPRAFDLLVTLVEHAGHLVTKDELLERVWPRVIVEEAALQMQVSSLRKILGRDAIVTISGRGYRFALVVARIGAEPTVSATGLKHNLPQQLTSFVGREKQLSELEGLLGRTRLLTLTGSGGCGKTRLAMQMAADLTGAYPDGIWLVEFAALADPALVPHAVAQVLGLREQPGKHLTQTIADHLASRHLLMLLDNAEHVLEACAQLADAVLRASAKLDILVTSRERLGIVGELTYRVPSLSAPGPEQRAAPEQISAYESARLFIERAQLQLPGFVVTAKNAPALASICHRLDGIPLAIELAAARVRSMPVEEVSRRLDQRFDLLTGGSRTALPRHQTLRSLIDWSYGLLSNAEQALLRRVSVFSGGWTLEAAEQVCVGEMVDGKDLLDLLTSLADKSLVLAKEHRGATRFALLETVRYYARDRLWETGEETHSIRRHLDHVLALAEEADAHLLGAQQQVWLERLETEHDNLRAALAWSCGPDGNAADGLRLASALGMFWSVRGHFAEGRRWLSALIAATPNGHSEAVRGNALRRSGILATAQADYPAAQKLLDEALATFRRLGDRLGIARVLHNLGTAASGQGKLLDAQALLEEGLVIRRELGDKQGISIGLNNLGVVAYEQGNYPMAQALWNEALALQRVLGDRGTVATLTHNLGTVIRDQGDYSSARTLLEEALCMHRELGSRIAIADSLEAFAALALAQGQPARAARLWGRATQLREELGAELPHRARSRFDQDVAAARKVMGDDTAFDAAWEEGRAMTPEQAMRYLLES